jgi:hypothetical protein
MMRDLIFPHQGFIDFCRRQASGVAELNGASDEVTFPDPALEPAPLSESNLVCSDRKDDDLHIPILDVDMPAMLLKSSTYGHYHLYIDKPMSWENYCKLLDVLAEVGILEQGYVDVSKKRKRTQVRTPWTKKEE